MDKKIAENIIRLLLKAKFELTGREAIAVTEAIQELHKIAKPDIVPKKKAK